MKIRRTFIKLDVIQAFQDPVLNTSSINIIFINQRDREEEGSGVGVTRELPASFWQETWKSTLLGCEKRFLLFIMTFRKQNGKLSESF